MKKTFIFAAMAAIAMTACNKEEIAAPEEGQNLVYREYTATIEDGASTKVAFGTPGENTIPAYFQDGDEIALTDGTNVYKGTVSVPENGGNTIIKTDVPEEFALTEAYYPYDAYKDGKLTVPATQTYGSVPVLLQSSDIEGENITFSAAEAGSAVICYTLTGDIAVKEAYLYYKDDASFWVGDDKLLTSDYTLSFDSPLQLSSEPQKIYFAVPAGTKCITLEIKTAAPESAYGNADYSYYRRKSSAMELASGNVVEMPATDFTAEELNKRVIWEFGAANDNDCGWKVSNNGSIDGSANSDYATVTMGVQTATTAEGYTVYRGDFIYDQDFEFYAGSYRFLAFKSTVPQLIEGNEALLPEGSVLGGNPTIKFDISNLGQWRNNQNKSMTLETSAENCEIWVYDMLVHFGSSKNYAPTAEPFSSTGNFQFKIADLGLTADQAIAPTYDMYWIGFFNSIEEIEAYIAETEAAVAGESTPAE